MTVSRETLLKDYELAVIAENLRQNLVSPASLADFATRHIQDSLQLAELVPASGAWLDIGSGAGLPGIPIAITRPDITMVLVEPRAKRATFLETCKTRLALSNVEVARSYVERISRPPVDVITARAVASMGKLFAIAGHLAHPATIWLLPRGRMAMDELDGIRAYWSGQFEIIPSRTSPDSWIVIARDVRAAGR